MLGHQCVRIHSSKFTDLATGSKSLPGSASNFSATASREISPVSYQCQNCLAQTRSAAVAGSIAYVESELILNAKPIVMHRNGTGDP